MLSANLEKSEVDWKGIFSFVSKMSAWLSKDWQFTFSILRIEIKDLELFDFLSFFFRSQTIEIDDDWYRF